MKRAVLALALLMILLASAAVAQSFSEKGLSVFLSAGDDRRAIEALVVFTDQLGDTLTPCDGVLTVPEKECINVQVFPKGATGRTDFIIGYSTDTIMPREPKRAIFDPAYGWGFVLTPQETAQAPGYVRALQLKLIDRDGIKSSVTVVFKFTYGSKWLTQYNQLIIKTVPRSEMYVAGGSGGSDAFAAIEAMKSNDQKIVDRVNDNDVRLTNLENWAKSISGGNSASATSPYLSQQTVTFQMCFTGNWVGIGMRITRPDGKVDGYVVKTTSQTLSLPRGRNTVDLLVDYGSGVVIKKKPIDVVVDSDTKLITIDVSRHGGGGRR